MSGAGISLAGESGLVSVVIPTYNRAYILGKAIESALSQTYKCVEVVVVDDGSTDDTRRLVESYGPPVRYLHQPNAGVSFARNHGLREARGEFVALLDSDDQWLPWKLDAQVQLMRAHPEVGMFWTDMAGIDGKGKVIHPAFIRIGYSAHRGVRIESILECAGSLKDAVSGLEADVADRPVLTGDMFSHMILGNYVHTSTVLIRRSRLVEVGGFDEALIRSGGDYEFHLHTCAHGPVGFIDASSVLYRYGSDDQLTAKRYMLNTARNNLATVRKWLDRGKGRITLSRTQIRNHLAECHDWLGNEKLAAGDSWGGRQELLRSLRFVPWKSCSWIRLGYSFVPDRLKNVLRWIRRKLRGRGGSPSSPRMLLAESAPIAVVTKSKDQSA